MKNANLQITDRELRFTRIFSAPRELLWQVMTDPTHVTHWWGPEGFRTETEVMDLRAGGSWKHVMIGPDGHRYPNHTIFVEVVAPERIRYRNTGSDDPERHVEFIATWNFRDLGHQTTELEIQMLFENASDLKFANEKYGATQGALQMLDRLEVYLRVPPAIAPLPPTS